MQATHAPQSFKSGLRRLLISPHFIFGVALAARLAYLAYGVWTRPTLPGKYTTLGYEAGHIARCIAEGRGFSSPLGVESGPSAWITPVFPYLLALIFKVFGVFTLHSEIAIKTLNCAFSALTCFPLFWTGRRLFGTAVAAAGAWLWAFHYSAVFFATNWVGDTSLSALMMTLLLCATYALDDSDSPRSWAVYGGLWALGVLTNASVLSVFPGFLGYAAYRARRRGASWLRLAALSLVVLGVGVSPWLVRNQIVFHRQVLFRSNFGLELWLGNNPAVPDTWTWWLHPSDNVEEREKFRRMGEVPYMKEKQRLALEFIWAHPADFTRFSLHRFLINWTGMSDPVTELWQSMPWRIKINLIANCAFSLLALIGLLRANRSEPVQSFPLSFMLLVFPIVYYISHVPTSMRYRHPIDPAMALLVVYAGAHFLRALQKNTQGLEQKTREADLAAQS